MSSKAIAIYDFRLQKWLYFDGEQFRLMELKLGQLLRLPQQHSWVKIER